MNFSNKSDNLSLLKNLNLKKSSIPKFISIKVNDWISKNKSKILINIKKELNDKVCIRSSFINEDKKNESMAGVFDSSLNKLGKFDGGGYSPTNLAIWNDRLYICEEKANRVLSFNLNKINNLLNGL